MVETRWMAVLVLLAGCGGDMGSGTDAGGGGFDAGGGGFDAGTPVDGGGGMDAAAPMIDAGMDASSPATDAGTDAGFDAGPGSILPDGGLMLACTLEEVQPIFECARMECVDLPDASLPGLPDGGFDLEAGLPDASFSLPDASLPDPTELATCILTSCWREVFGVSDACRGCLLAGVGMNLDEIRMRCAPGLAGLP